MEQTTIIEHDVQIADYIWVILKSNVCVMLSWGIDPRSIKTITYGTQFHVQGFKLIGTVKVTLNEGADLFEVEFIKDTDKEHPTKLTGIYFDQLIDIIDTNVEKVENYEKRVQEELSK